GTGSVPESNLSHRYVWGEVVDQLFADEQVTSLSSAGSTYWMMTDGQGSITDVLDSNGKLRIHRIFDAYGNVVDERHYNTSGSLVWSGIGYINEPFGWTGKWRDSFTGD